MPIEITVGPPILAIHQGRTFMVTDLGGEVVDKGEQGLFARDTRFLSYYAISANGERWVVLSSSVVSYYAARVYLTNAPFSTEEGEVPAGKLGLVLSRSVGEGIHEDLDMANHGPGAVRFNLEIATRSDFADLFEVKSHKFVRRGHIESQRTRRSTGSTASPWRTSEPCGCTTRIRVRTLGCPRPESPGSSACSVATA